jgi:hypothetical protein
VGQGPDRETQGKLGEASKGNVFQGKRSKSRQTNGTAIPRGTLAGEMVFTRHESHCHQKANGGHGDAL